MAARIEIPDVKSFVRNELIDFTRLPASVVDKYIARKQYPNHNEEWSFWHPDSDENIRWYYVASRAYLFANARHSLPSEVLSDVPAGSRVLDFGGGSGNYSFGLINKQCKVQYFEINILQREFVRFVAGKHQLPVDVLEHDGDYLPIFKSEIDVALALDVLEHIPDYPKYVEQISRNMTTGGRLYVFAPFGKGDGPHLQDRSDLAKVLKENGFVRSGVKSRFVKEG